VAVVITPEKGQAARIGKILLALASDVKDVQWVSSPVGGFAVPQELFELFEQAMAALRDTGGEGLMPIEPIEPVVQEPRKRGRPRKAVPAVEEGQEE
jgi:hypothetical protein